MPRVNLSAEIANRGLEKSRIPEVLKWVNVYPHEEVPRQSPFNNAPENQLAHQLPPWGAPLLRSPPDRR